MTYACLEKDCTGWVGVSQLCDNRYQKASYFIEMASKRQLQRGERTSLRKNELNQRHDCYGVPKIILPSFSHLIVEKASCVFHGVEESCAVFGGDAFIGQKFTNSMKLNV